MEADGARETAVEPDVIFSEFDERKWPRWSGSVRIDRRTGEIEFRNCFVRHRSVGWREPCWVSSKDSLRAVDGRWIGGIRPSFLLVITTEGKAEIPRPFSNAEELEQWLSEAVPSNDPDYLVDGIAMAYVYVLGALGGLMLGWLLGYNLSFGGLAASLVGGAACGTAFCWGLVALAARRFGVDLVHPLAGLFFGMYGSLAISVPLMKLLQWGEWVMFGPVVVGSIVGLIVGIKIRTRSVSRKATGT